MIIAAVVISVLSVIVNAWAINQCRLLNQWTRSRFAGPMPAWWQLRWRPSREWVSPYNAEETVKRYLGNAELRRQARIDGTWQP